MRARRFDSTRARAAAALLLAGTLVALASPRVAAAYCDLVPGTFLPNTPYALNYPDDQAFHWKITPNRPFWIVVGAIAYDPTDDYDVSMYPNTPNPGSGDCYAGLLTRSSAGAGRTDVVVGDFNHNPYATYVNWEHCYSGHCDSQERGFATWRDGELFYVDDPPLVFTQPALVDRVAKIWDVYLFQGTTYHFRFQPTGDGQPKLLLFRNTTGGTYWAPRAYAEFETAECMTNYTAPSTGYYGMVVVNDRYTTNPVSITLAVTTTPGCACPGVLANGVPQVIPSTKTEAVNAVVQDWKYWMAVGVRSPSDWDLGEGTTPASGPNVGCIESYGAISSLFPPQADVVVGDFNATLPWDLPATYAVRAVRYSGADGASVEMEGGTEILISNGSTEAGYLTSDDVVRVWDAYLVQGKTYTLQFYPSVADMKLLVFGNLGYAPSLWLPRSGALLETSGPTTFTAPVTGSYGFVIVKQDAQIGGYSLRYGDCQAPLALTPKTPEQQLGFVDVRTHLSFTQPTESWAAACVYGPTADWDIAQYSQPSGLPWPECFGDEGARSNGTSGVDLIAGDFHFVPTGTSYLHSYPYTAGVYPTAYAEWDPGSGYLTVNASQPVLANAAAGWNADRLWCYEVYLVSGVPYTVVFSPAGGAALRLLMFENPGSSPYWAPRSGAVLSTATPTTYTPTTTGWHGVVVVNDNDQAGSFSLGIVSGSVDVAGEVAPTRDGLASVAPNPARGPLRIEYTLSRAARPAFEILDVAGRLVSRVPAAAAGPGRWSLTWDGRGASGEAVPGGLYVVRMSVDGRPVDTRKVMRMN